MATDKMIKDARGSVLLTGIVAEEDGQFVSYCRELGTASCGDTIEEAFDNLWDAVEVHLDALAETDEILRVLREKNIRIDYDDEPPIDEPYLRVPLGKIVNIYRKTLPVALMV
jgi:predicted RNase H-like HicB family nuclease